MAPVSVDLDNCDREPIHVPGSIQPHGALIVCEGDAATIAFASANAARVLGLGEQSLVDRSLIDVFGVEAAHELRNALAKSGTAAAGASMSTQRIGDAMLDVVAHRHDGRFLIEFEPTHGPTPGGDALDITQAMIRRIGMESDVEAIAVAGARLVRTTLGYDRVMVYRFLHNDAGRVIAESKRADMHSFLGQHFPAADIPAQARRLYLLNWMRAIADSNYAPVPLLSGKSAQPRAVDMSFAHLRSVSPIHCEYLRNMGVGASLSISIVIDGKLWGLIACHHDTPKTVPMPMRVAAELFGQYFSLQLTVAEKRAEFEVANTARQRLDRLERSLPPDQTVEVGLLSRLAGLAGLIPCDGAGFWLNGAWTATGSTPSRDAIEPVIHMLAQQEMGSVWDTNELRSLIGQDAPDCPVAGLLAVPASAQARDYLMLFRNEEAQSVVWAGAPSKNIVSGPLGSRLTPRGSFEAWREDVRGRARPWTDAERVVAGAIKTYLRDIALRHNELLEVERVRIEQRGRMLNDELNHRVKNILALVKSIATQTGVHAQSVADYTSSLEGRLRALSYAHDQSLMLDNRGELSALFDAEASLHRYGAHERVKLSGPRLAFSENAFSTLALVVHEMMTNAAKYGALSVPAGQLSIEWRLTADGDCVIDWSENDGPEGFAPTHRGFGSTLIERSMTYDLGGTVHIDYAVQGLQGQFVIPARHIIPLQGDAIERIAPVAATKPLEGLRAMLLEDRALIALDTENILYGLGARAVDSFPNVAAASTALVAVEPDIGVLDFNLGGETSADLADWFVSRRIPFVFLTGYTDSASIPSRFAHIPVIRKPVDVDATSEVLASILKR